MVEEKFIEGFHYFTLRGNELKDFIKEHRGKSSDVFGAQMPIFDPNQNLSQLTELTLYTVEGTILMAKIIDNKESKEFLEMIELNGGTF